MEKNAIDVEKKNLGFSDSGRRTRDLKMAYIVFAKAVEVLRAENKKVWRVLNMANKVLDTNVLLDNLKLIEESSDRSEICISWTEIS